MDVSNPLDFSGGFPPSLTVFGTDSLAEQIQRGFPRTRVVKTLNTVSARVMTHPLEVANGDLSTARGTEAYLLLWLRLYGSMNTGMINIKVMK